MNRFFWLLAILPLSLFALEGDLQVRGGYFRFADHTVRKVYRQGAPDIELQGDFFLHKLFNPWVNFNYVWKEGKSDPLNNRTQLKLGTLSFGSNLQVCFHRRSLFYLGVGLTTAYLHLSDHSDFLPHHTVRWSAGVVGKSGLLVNLDRFLFNVFFDYYFQPVSPRSTLDESFIDLGGFRTGVGLGTFF